MLNNLCFKGLVESSNICKVLLFRFARIHVDDPKSASESHNDLRAAG